MAVGINTQINMAWKIVSTMMVCHIY